LALTHDPGSLTPALTGAVQRQLQERRFAALAAAVREHEVRGAAQVVRGRPHDQALYRRLRQLSAATRSTAP
jgi:hypothetical protein